MKKTYLKIIINEIRQSFGRFMAIFGIVALGVGFLSGLLVTTPDMHYSVDEYYDKHNMLDIFIKGTMGITDDDIRELSAMDEIDEIMPAYVTDILMEGRKNDLLTTRVYGIPILKDDIRINKLELLEGRMPENKNECLIERKGGFLPGIPIGTKLAISKNNDNYEDIDDIYNVDEFTVVGIVSNSFYFSMEREQTSIGSGKLNSIIYVDESSYALDVYTDLYITAKEAREMDSFSKEYETKMKSIVRSIEKIEKERSLVRFDQVLLEARDELNDGIREYEEGKLEAETELADAYKELEDGRKELKDAWKEIGEGKIELADAKVTLEEERLKAEVEIEDARIELADALIKLEDGEKELQEAKEKLKDGQKGYQDGYREYLDAKKELEEGQSEFDKAERDYEDGKKQLEDARRDIREGERELSSAQAELDDGQRQYNDGVRQLRDEKRKFEQGMDLYLAELPFSSVEELFREIDRGNAGAKQGLDSVIAGFVQAVEGEKSKLESQKLELEAGMGQLVSLIDQLKNAEQTPENIQTIKELEGQVNMLERNLADLNGGLIELEKTLEQMPRDSSIFINGWQEIKKAERQLADAKAEIEYGLREIEKGYEELRIGKRELQKAERELEDGKIELEENRQKLIDGWDELEEGRIELEDGKKDLDEGYEDYYEGLRELDDGWIDYRNGLVELADAEESFKSEIQDANDEIRKAEADLSKGIGDYNEGLKELADGEVDYIEAKLDVEKELREAEQEILDGQKEIDELEVPKWYVLDRNYNMSYASFLLNAEKVAAVAKVFPVFFYLIAALVALTTMTRMVEEERTQIGTLKALGYTKGTIMFKYLVYCGLASILGSILGLVVGFKLIPIVIWNAYGTMYHLPSFLTQFDTRIASISSGLAILSTMIATVYACNQALKEKPFTLMLPRAPKAGKRILLERVGFIWSRMSFNHKATARNIFRYKKHFFMTVIGIGGCTALLMAGFGLRDSIGSVANTQFVEIFKYDILVDLEENKAIDSKIQLILEDTEKVRDHMEVYKDKGKIHFDGESLEASIFIPDSFVNFNEFVNLRDSKTHKEIPFNDSSVVITEKIAETLNLSIGDEIEVEDSDDKVYRFKITGIAENYLGNYIYMSKELYLSAMGGSEENNSIILKTTLTDTRDQDKLVSSILESDSVINAEFISQTKETFDNLLASINYIVIVIILASGILAFIVLYNLTNININERKKELATLKVLGFFNEEVSGYIFRETTILTLIGIGAGLLLGVLLHGFIILTIEETDFMFGRKISSLSYMLSALITIMFSLVVNFFMNKKLRSIEMVESMKAID